MKINVALIVRAHWKTLYDANSNRTNYSDLLIFYALPIAGGVLAYWLNFTIKSDVYNVSVTFFGIFIALLLNIQVAIFGIFQRKWDIPVDKRQAAVQCEQLASRRTLLAELNTNISYLTVVSSIALTVFLAFFTVEKLDGIAPAITVVLYSHFILTFMMIAKRSHSLFQKEYDDSPYGE